MFTKQNLVQNENQKSVQWKDDIKAIVIVLDAVTKQIIN